MMRSLITCLFLLITLPACAASSGDFPQPLMHGHAHNDYEHARPLAEALECGFTSIEADIHVIHNQILVAHDRHRAEAEAGSTARTLQTLYLDPLRKRAEANNGRIYPDLPSIFLLIDMKSDPAAPAYKVLVDVLKQYSSILTTWDAAGRHTRAVTIIITGNHTHAMIAADPVRYCASDGLLSDLDQPDLSPELCPLISSEWKKTFTWNGKGEMSSFQRDLLRQIVEHAHSEHRLIRFWGAPDNKNTWKQLRAAGVDLINTDDLQGLKKFLLQQ